MTRKGSSTMTEDAMEQAISSVNARFPNWKPTPSMLGYARAVTKCALEHSDAVMGEAVTPAMIDAAVDAWDSSSGDDRGRMWNAIEAALRSTPIAPVQDDDAELTEQLWELLDKRTKEGSEQFRYINRQQLSDFIKRFVASRLSRQAGGTK